MNDGFTRCQNDHYYNHSEYKYCPYCKKYASEISSRRSDVIKYEIPSTANHKRSNAEIKQVATNIEETEILQNEYEETVILSGDNDE